jgi:hypothetical protein
MQSVASINHDVIMDQERRSALNETMGRRVMNRLLGCWIHELGRPFSHNGQTYRVCIKCGMSRDFDPASWKTHGHYHATEPNFSYPKISACRPVRTNQERSHYTPATTSSMAQRVSSIGSMNQGQFGPETGFAA